ncbi:MAG: hypothetical protein ACRD88_22750, partial [Terriglobia bacterium]
MTWAFLVALLVLLLNPRALQAGQGRTVSGTIVTSQNEAVTGVSVIVRSLTGEQVTTSDLDGKFHVVAPEELLTLRIEGRYVRPQERVLAPGDPTEDLLLAVQFVIPPVHESLTIVAAPLEPGVDRRNPAVYQKTLFSRDDQIFHALDAGINTGQHEGGGKSLEIRRFGFNLDHGGVSGGLKVLLDNVQQNQPTQGHGQGYLG